MKKPILFLFVFLLLVSLVSAAKTVQTSVSTVAGLDIRIPQGEFLERNTDVTSNIHVFNKSSGIVMTNETTSCLLHIYNKSGDHIAEEDYSFSKNNIDFTLDIDGNNFSQLGIIAFLIKCNTSNEGGFVSGSFEVTETGEEEETEAEAIKLIAALIGILILAAVLIVFAFKLDEEHYILKIFFMLMALATLTVIPQLLIKGIYYAGANILNISLWAYRFFIIYLFLYIFYNWARKSERFLKWFGSQK